MLLFFKRFFQNAFQDMKVSAQAQHQLDKAQLEAVKAESRAHFEEHRGRNTLARAKDARRARREAAVFHQAEALADANARIAAANARCEQAKR